MAVPVQSAACSGEGCAHPQSLRERLIPPHHSCWPAAAMCQHARCRHPSVPLPASRHQSLAALAAAPHHFSCCHPVPGEQQSNGPCQAVQRLYRCRASLSQAGCMEGKMLGLFRVYHNRYLQHDTGIVRVAWYRETCQARRTRAVPASLAAL